MSPTNARRLPLVAAALLCCAAPARSADTEWTGWLGPQRTGFVEGYQPPATWPDELVKQWQVDVGTGYGSPLVADGRVWQHGRQGENEVIRCLDLKTGETIWEQSDRTPFKIGGGAEFHGKGPKSSPALAEGRVFTLSITGVLTARDAGTGRKLWQRDYSGEFGQNHPYWGASTSPLVDGDHVIVHLGNDERGALFAFDAATGEEVWRQGKDAAAYSSAILIEIDGVRQVIDWNQRVLTGVDAATGTQLWETPFPQVSSDQNMPTPSFHDGHIIVGAENRGVRSFSPRKNRDGTWTVAEDWHQKDVALDMSTAVVRDGLLYGFSHYRRGQLFCLDLATGDVLWSGPGRTGDNVTFLTVEGYVLALTDTGTLQIFAATGEGYEPVATYKVADTPSWAPPVLLEDGLLIKAETTLTRWGFVAAGQ